MKRVGALCLVVLVTAASPAIADVKITATISMHFGPTVMNTSMVTWFKGTVARADVKIMDQDQSVIMDAGTKRQWRIDHAAKQVEPVDLNGLMASLPFAWGEASMSVKPTGQTKEILGRTCTEFSIEMTVPMILGADSLVMRTSGSAWIAKDSPGAVDYLAFQKAAADAGLVTAWFAQGIQPKGMVEVQKLLAEAGIPYEQEMHMSMEGTGQMAQTLSQMGNTVMSMKVTAISTDSIPEETFATPAGYTKK